MKIIKLEAEGFRSLRSQSWVPGDLNVLIGPNASGKSNVLRILEMLSAASRGGLGTLIQQEGGMEPLLWDGQIDRVKLLVKTTPTDSSRDPERDALTYELMLSRLGRTSDYRIQWEQLANHHRVEQGTSQQPFKLLERNVSRGVIFDENEHSLVAPEASIPDDETLLSVVGGPFTQNRHLLNRLPDYDLSKESEEREPEEQESLRRDREPWFYSYLEKYAKILQILGYVLAAGSAVLATIWFIVGAISAMSVSAGFGVMMLFLTFLGWVLGLAGIAAALLLWLVSVAAILLAVDAARNLRDLKKATATAPIPK